MDFYKYLGYLVKQIPPGFVSTYTHLALALGEKRAMKTVQEVLETFHKNTIPWYRVVGDNGQIVGDKKKQEKKKKITPTRKCIYS